MLAATSPTSSPAPGAIPASPPSSTSSISSSAANVSGSETASPASAPHSTLADHGYELDNGGRSKIGVGAHGRVYRGRRISDGQAVAMKVVLPTLEAWEEVRLHQRCLPHPHIVDLYDAFEADFFGETRLIIVLELCTGGDLFNFIKQQPGYKLQENAARDLLRYISAAITHIHNCGVVHHDVKAENVLLTRRKTGNVWMAKLCDFGLAKTIDAHRQEGTLVAGFTAAYAAPEIVFRAEFSSFVPRCDVWALGVMFYVMLSGYPPFFSEQPTKSGGGMPSDMARAIQRGQFGFLQQDWQSVSSEAKRQINRMLAPNPEARYSSAEIEIALFHDLSVHRAAECGAEAMVEFIVTSDPAKVNVPSPNGTTPLAAAVNGNALDIVRMLLRMGAVAVLDEPNMQGWTPVAMAAYRGHDEVLNELLSHGASPTKTVSFGDGLARTPVSLAGGAPAARRNILHLLSGHRSPALPTTPTTPSSISSSTSSSTSSMSSMSSSSSSSSRLFERRSFCSPAISPATSPTMSPALLRPRHLLLDTPLKSKRS